MLVNALLEFSADGLLKISSVFLTKILLYIYIYIYILFFFIGVKFCECVDSDDKHV